MRPNSGQTGAMCPLRHNLSAVLVEFLPCSFYSIPPRERPGSPFDIREFAGDLALAESENVHTADMAANPL